MKRFKLISVLVVVAFLTTTGLAMAGTLDDVKAKGFISVGVNEGLAGFSRPDDKGEWADSMSILPGRFLWRFLVPRIN
jgi:general L-amino acid transport system substrate-binding protein